MKHMCRFTLALLLVVATNLPAQTSNRWDLFQTLDWEGRLAFLGNQDPNSLDEAFLRQALDLTDSSRIESGPDNEVAVKKALAVQLIRKLADRPVPASASAIARIPVQYKDPVLRGESWLALAKLGDKTAVPTLIRNLNSLNDSGQRGRGEEIQATYILQALGILKAPEAFHAVVSAALGWYTPASQVRPLAKKTLPLLVADYEATLLDLLNREDDLTLREGLFQVVVDQGDAAFTAQAAASILGTLVRLQARDKADQDRTERLILSTLLEAQKAPSPPATLVAPLKVLLIRNNNFQEMVQSVQLLGKINDPAALNLLSVTLGRYNAQQKAGTNQPADLALVQKLFLALAATGKKEARTPLDEARFSDYTPALAREAAEALAKLPVE